jgi:hypothetical protein
MQVSEIYSLNQTFKVKVCPILCTHAQLTYHKYAVQIHEADVEPSVHVQAAEASRVGVPQGLHVADEGPQTPHWNRRRVVVEQEALYASVPGAVVLWLGAALAPTRSHDLVLLPYDRESLEAMPGVLLEPVPHQLLGADGGDG